MANHTEAKDLAWKIRKSIAMDRWQALGRRTELESMGLAPELYRRGKRGRPPKYAMQPPILKRGWEAPIYRDEHIWQLFCKQKWQAGKPSTNEDKSYGRDLNQCACAVADIVGANVSQIWVRIKRVPKERREEIELWLIKTLLAEGKIHPKKLAKAKVQIKRSE